MVNASDGQVSQLDLWEATDDWFARAQARMRRLGYRPDDRIGGPTFSTQKGDVVYLVACSKTKMTRRCAAKDLYTSPLFKLSRAVAEARGKAWGILSAKHGLVHPDELLDPYDDTLPRGEGATAWGYRTGRQISQRLFGARLVALAGARYLKPLRGKAFLAAKPLDGLQIGERLRALKDPSVTSTWPSSLLSRGVVSG